MQAAAWVLTLLVGIGEGRDPLVGTIARAIDEALGLRARVAIREIPGEPTDAQLREVQAATHSHAVAHVAWLGAERRQVRIRLQVSGEDRVVERMIEFQVSDAPAERARTVGFAVASLLPGERASLPPATAVAASGTPPPAAAPSPGEDRTDNRGLAVDALAVTSLGVGGNADGVGAALAARKALGATLAVRVALGGRMGVVERAQATSLALRAAVGLAFTPLAAAEGRPWSLGLRADAALLHDSLTHLDSDDDRPDQEGRWLPGMDLLVEGTWRLGRAAALVVGAGTEIAFGRTEVFLRGERVALIPPLRIVGEIGLREYF